MKIRSTAHRPTSARATNISGKNEEAKQPTDEVVLKSVMNPHLKGSLAATGLTLAGAGLGSLHSWMGSAIGGAVGLAAGLLAYRAILPGIGYAGQAKSRAQTNAEVSEQALDYKAAVKERRHSPIPAALGKDSLIAVDPVAEVARKYDGFDSSRDLFALYAKEGHSQEPYALQVEFANLRAGAERAHINSDLTIKWDDQTLILPVKDDEQHAPELNAYYSPEHSTLRMALDKSLLREQGWTDSQELKIEVSTGVDKIAGLTGKRLASDELGKVFRWEGQTIYYAVTDRFHNGDKSNDQGTDPKDPERFHGGDWQGVIDKLDHLDSLGVDCIWLSCPYENERDFLGMDGYHGYWPTDFSKAEPSFGNKKLLKELTKKAHQKGMKVMLDVVVNHTGYNHPWTREQDKADWFHHEGKIWSKDQYAMEHGSLAGLPDLAQENPEVADYLIDVHRSWMDDTGVDALRLDAVRHVPEDFLQRFNEAMREGREDDYLSIGEAFWQDGNFVAGYQNRTLDSMFDFRTAYAIRKVFASDPNRSNADRLKLADEVDPHNDQEAARLREGPGGQSMKLLSEAFKHDKYYDNPRKLSTFVDNHDMIRFMSDTGGDERKLELALAFLYAIRGMPTLYYGTEAAMEGTFPGNRGDLSAFPETPLAPVISKLSNARENSEALALGVQKELYCDDDVYALARVRPDQTAVCLFNNSEQPRTVKVPLEGTGLGHEAVLSDLLDQATTQAREGFLTVTLPSKGYRFLSGHTLQS